MNLLADEFNADGLVERVMAETDALRAMWTSSLGPSLSRTLGAGTSSSSDDVIDRGSLVMRGLGGRASADVDADGGDGEGKGEEGSVAGAGATALRLRESELNHEELEGTDRGGERG